MLLTRLCGPAFLRVWSAAFPSRPATPCTVESSPGKLVGCYRVAPPSTPGERSMGPLTLPEPIAHLVATLADLLDARQADLLPPLVQGILFGHGRRTATAWF